MNETEKRRRQLLEQTRKTYGNSNATPAVHPRYSAAYASLYGREDDETEVSGLGFRFFIAVILFSVFVAIDYSGEQVAAVDSKRIVEEIEADIDIEDIEEVWKNL